MYKAVERAACLPRYRAKGTYGGNFAAFANYQDAISMMPQRTSAVSTSRRPPAPSTSSKTEYNIDKLLRPIFELIRSIPDNEHEVLLTNLVTLLEAIVIDGVDKVQLREFVDKIHLVDYCTFRTAIALWVSTTELYHRAFVDWKQLKPGVDGSEAVLAFLSDALVWFLGMDVASVSRVVMIAMNFSVHLMRNCANVEWLAEAMGTYLAGSASEAIADITVSSALNAPSSPIVRWTRHDFFNATQCIMKSGWTQKSQMWSEFETLRAWSQNDEFRRRSSALLGLLGFSDASYLSPLQQAFMDGDPPPDKITL